MEIRTHFCVALQWGILWNPGAIKHPSGLNAKSPVQNRA